MADAPQTDPETETDAAAGPPSASADATAEPTPGAPEDLKSSFRDALARKAGRNSHVENHLDGRHLGSGNNDTHKRQFRRKSG